MSHVAVVVVHVEFWQIDKNAKNLIIKHYLVSFSDITKVKSIEFDREIED